MEPINPEHFFKNLFSLDIDVVLKHIEPLAFKCQFNSDIYNAYNVTDIAATLKTLCRKRHTYMTVAVNLNDNLLQLESLEMENGINIIQELLKLNLLVKKK